VSSNKRGAISLPHDRALLLSRRLGIPLGRQATQPEFLAYIRDRKKMARFRALTYAWRLPFPAEDDLDGPDHTNDDDCACDYCVAEADAEIAYEESQEEPEPEEQVVTGWVKETITKAVKWIKER